MKYLDLTGLQKFWAKVKNHVQTSLQGYAKKTDLSKVATSGSYNDLTNRPTAHQHDLVYIDALTNLLPTELSATHGFAYCTKCGLAMITPKLEDTNTYLVTESREYLTDEQGNLLIL